ncbi:MAG: hypothetical protein ACI9U2_002877, partial [Bradymonadia bacterium]
MRLSIILFGLILAFACDDGDTNSGQQIVGVPSVPSASPMPPTPPVEPAQACADDTPPCINDTDCESGTRCNTALTPPACQTLYSGGAACLCSQDAFCGEGLLCNDAACREYPYQEGLSCQGTSDCQDGLFCEGARCGRQPPFTGVAVTGACKVDDSLSQIDVSVVFSGPGGEGILPGDSVQLGGPSAGELLNASSFQWEPLDAEFQGAQGSAFGVASGLSNGVGLVSDAVRFDFTGGADRKDDERLVVFALDHSGSLIGEDLVNGGVDISVATDIRDERIAFFRTLVGQLPESISLSLVSFQGQLPIIDAGQNGDGPAVPTRNRDIIFNALSDLESGSSGTTPLARTLADTLSSILLPNIQRANGSNDLNGALVLFTDGVEIGDPTDTNDRAGLDRA